MSFVLTVFQFLDKQSSIFLTKRTVLFQVEKTPVSYFLAKQNGFANKQSYVSSDNLGE